MKIDPEKFKKLIKDEIQYSVDCGERPMEELIAIDQDADREMFGDDADFLDDIGDK